MSNVFGDNLKMYMGLRGFNNTTLGERIGVTDVTISYWIHGKRDPRMSMVDKLCEVFHCTRTDLMMPNSVEIALERESYREVLELVSSLNKDGLDEVINFCGNLADRFYKGKEQD